MPIILLLLSIFGLGCRFAIEDNDWDILLGILCFFLTVGFLNLIF